MADWASSPATPFPLDGEQFTSSPPPLPAPAPAAPVAALALAPPTPAPAPAQPAPRRRRRNKTTPPGFPGYRWVAQTVALQASPRRPQVQLGRVYAPGVLVEDISSAITSLPPIRYYVHLRRIYRLGQWPERMVEEFLRGLDVRLVRIGAQGAVNSGG